MADKTAKRPLRVETELETNRRHQYLLFDGPPMPDGWKLPPLIEPPARSDPDAVGRAEREIESLKAAQFQWWQHVPFGPGVTVEPGQKGVWGDMDEFDKFDVLRHWVNWQGVNLANRAGIMAARLDLGKLTPELREQLIEDAGLRPAGADHVEGQGFEAMHRVRSPSEIAQQSRSAGPQQPDGRANGQSRGKDRSDGR